MEKINPNWLTASRLVFFMPLALILLQINTPTALAICLVAMILAELTDHLDGRIARATNQVSEFGKFFDPICDTILHTVVWINFLVLGWAPIYFVVIFVTRDLIGWGIRGYMATQGKVLAARNTGKAKTASQAAAQIVIIFLHLVLISGVLLSTLQFTLITAAILVTIYSGYDYIANFIRLIKKQEIVLN